MCFPGPRNIDPNIHSRLVESLLERVLGQCASAKIRVTPSSARRHVESAIELYMDEWLAFDEDNEWAEWVESHYPEFDASVGGDQGESGNEEELREEFRDEKRLERLGWYYEDNGMGVIEKAAVEAIRKAPAKRQPKKISAKPRTRGRTPRSAARK